MHSLRWRNTCPERCPPRTTWSAPFSLFASINGIHATGCSVRSIPGVK